MAKVPVPGLQAYQSLTHKPEFVKVTTDTERRRDWLEMDFEFNGTLGEFSGFLSEVRQDLWERGFWTRSIEMMSTGLSAASIEPSLDPVLTGYAVFKVAPRAEGIGYSQFLEGMRAYLGIVAPTAGGR
jgi:hypothetical protein